MGSPVGPAFCVSSPGLWPEGLPVVIIGAGGLGRELLGICYALGAEDRVLGFLDPEPAFRGKALDGKPVLGDDEWFTVHAGPELRFLLGVGDNASRRRIAQRLERNKMEPATLVSPDAVVSRFSRLLPGSVICPGSVISTSVAAGRYCLVNPACTIGHDADLSDFVHLAPGVRISGWATLGEGVYMGTGSAVSERIAVADWTIVGAMTAVTRDLPANVTAVGVPARTIAERGAGWHL